MESSETIGNLELLVKLASFGAAGISILAVFLIGIKIFNLPNDTSPVKASLLKFFMGMCIFMTIICGISSWANAYYTHNKVTEAKDNLNKLSVRYKGEFDKMKREKSLIQASLNNIKNQFGMALTPASRENLRNEIERANINLQHLQIAPIDTVLSEIKRSKNNIKPKP